MYYAPKKYEYLAERAVEIGESCRGKVSAENNVTRKIKEKSSKVITQEGLSG